MRGNFHSLRVTRISSYERKLSPDHIKLVWRYAFERVRDGKKFVYSGRLLPVKVNQIISLRATIKVELDDFRFCRISRPQLIDLQEEFPL